MKRLGISQFRPLDPTVELNKSPGTITARFPLHMLHLDVKKIGRIPDGGGGWVHGRGTDEALKAERGPGTRFVHSFLDPAVDGFPRLAYTKTLEDEQAPTTIRFLAVHGPLSPPITSSASSGWSPTMA